MKRLTIFSAVGAAGVLALVPVFTSQAATSAATTPASTSYPVTVGQAARTAQSATGVAGLTHVTESPLIESPSKAPRMLTGFRSPGGQDAAAKATGSGAPKVTAQAPATSAASRVTSAFDGLNDLTSDQLIGAITPPDQGLCIGPDHTAAGVPDAVWEVVNAVGQETTKTGTVISGPVNLPTLFQDQFSVGDPRCLYDPSTQSFYFTEIGFPVAAGPNSTETNTVDDLLVVNSRGAASYQLDSSLGGNCLGDQPKTGFDNNAIIISTDEYCGPTLSNYEGAIVNVISKPQAVSEASTVNYAVLGPVALAGDPVVGLDPAINTGTSAGYLVNSVAFLADGSNNPVGTTLGLWTLTNTASVTSGNGTPALASQVLGSEPYAFPVPAPSTGSGHHKQFNKTVITSETALNPDDSRLSGPVNVTPAAGGGLDLWTALDAAVAPAGSVATQDGAAWFEISTARQKVVSQGYVAASNASLLYPAVYASPGGSATMVYTVTGSTTNPSAAYSVLGQSGVNIVAAGSGPHWSFSDAKPFLEPRWGDYSWAAPDPVSGQTWMATEYIPPTAEWDGFDNWGTYVFAVG